MDKIGVLAERMALSKVTLHTAMSYIDRLVVSTYHGSGLEGAKRQSSLVVASGGKVSLEAKKVITPRQKVMLGTKQIEPPSSGFQTTRAAKQIASQSPPTTGSRKDTSTGRLDH